MRNASHRAHNKIKASFYLGLGVLIVSLLGVNPKASAVCTTYDLYGATSTPPSTLYGINPANGIATAIGPIGYYQLDSELGWTLINISRVSGMDLDPNTPVLYATGQIFGFDNNSISVLMTIDRCTGVAAVVGATGIETLSGGGHFNISDISFRSDGKLFGYVPCSDCGSSGSQLVVTINTATGVATLVGQSGLGSGNPSGGGGNGIAFSSNNTLFHGTADGLRVIDQATGTSTFLGSLTQSYRPNGMDFHPTSGILYSSLPGETTQLGTIDTLPICGDGCSVTVTTLGATQAGLDALSFPRADTDFDGVLDSADNCPDKYNPVVPSWVDRNGVTHTNSQVDFDLDGVGDSCDNCKKTENADQADDDHDLRGNACEDVQEQLSGPSGSVAPGAQKWFTATFQNNTGSPINTIRPDCFNTLFTVNPSGFPGAPLPPKYRHRLYGVPDDVVTIPPGSFIVTCDLNEMFDPSVLNSGPSGAARTYDVKATYSNDIDPNNNLFVGAVESLPGTLTVEGTTVQQTQAFVTYTPNVFVQQTTGVWSTFNSPTLFAQLHFDPSPTGSPITLLDLKLNNCASPTSDSNNSVTSGVASPKFNTGPGTPLGLLDCLGTGLGTVPPGGSITIAVTIQGKFSGGSQNGKLFTGQGLITVARGVDVTIDIMPGTSPNFINLGAKGSVPVAILSSASFDARTVNPATVTLAGAPSNAQKQGTGFKDVNNDGLIDLVVQVDNTKLQLTKSSTTAVLKGLTFSNVPIAASGDVQIKQ